MSEYIIGSTKQSSNIGNGMFLELQSQEGEGWWCSVLTGRKPIAVMKSNDVKPAYIAQADSSKPCQILIG